MGKLIITDLKKLFGDYLIYLSMIGLGFAYILGYLEMIQGQFYVGGIDQAMLFIESNEIVLIAFLLCIVGGGFLYCREVKHGYLKFEIQRTGVGKYTLSKLITSLAGGFLTAIAGMIISIIGIIGILWIKYADKTLIWSDWEAFEQMMWVWILKALLCGVLSAMGFLVTTFVSNYYIGLITPLILYYVILDLEIWIPIPPILQFSNVYNNIIGLESGYVGYLIYALLYTSCLLTLFYMIAKVQIQRRLEHA